MTWSGILGQTAAGLGAVAVPAVLAAAGAGQAVGETVTTKVKTTSVARQWPGSGLIPLD